MVVLSVLEKGLQSYNGALYAQPLLTKALTSAFTGGLGDFLGQVITRRPTIDVQSITRYAAFGLLVSGPLAHNVYKLMDKLFPSYVWGVTVKRLLMDRLGFAPLLLCLSLYLLARFEGKSHETCVREVQVKFWSTLKMNWKVWTPIQYININYIPQQYRSLFANCVALFWIMYLTNKRRQQSTKSA